MRYRGVIGGGIGGCTEERKMRVGWSCWYRMTKIPDKKARSFSLVATYGWIHEEGIRSLGGEVALPSK